MKEFKAYYLSPIGPVEVSGTPEAIVSVSFVKRRLPNDRNLPECVKEGIRQLEEYLEVALLRGGREDQPDEEGGDQRKDSNHGSEYTKKF